MEDNTVLMTIGDTCETCDFWKGKVLSVADCRKVQEVEARRLNVPMLLCAKQIVLVPKRQAETVRVKCHRCSSLILLTREPSKYVYCSVCGEEAMWEIV